MSKALAEVNQSAVPAWMKSSGEKFGNVDASDLKPPRLKILAGQSPEVMDGVPGAAPGNFWLTILNKDMGRQVTGTPILLKKSYQLWHPRVAGVSINGPLATASDGVRWDIPDQQFEVSFPPNMGGGKETWKIGKFVTDFKMNKFGSSRAADPKSHPAATLTYDVLWVVDVGDGKKQLCVFTSSKTGVKPTQNFISQVMAQGVSQYYQTYRIISVKKTNDKTGDPYFTYDYQFAGLVKSEAEGLQMKALFDQYSESGFVADDGADDERTQTFSDGPSSRRPDGDDEDGIPF